MRPTVGNTGYARYFVDTFALLTHCLFVEQVITQCVRTFVDAQLRFFQSAAGQLAQFSSFSDNADCVSLHSSDTYAGDDTLVSQQVANVTDRSANNQITSICNDFLPVSSSNCLNKPPGLCVSPQLSSPQTVSMEKNQRSAGDHHANLLQLIFLYDICSCYVTEWSYLFLLSVFM